MSTKLFYLDKSSVISFDGKDIAYGDEIPAGIPEKSLNRLKKAGKVGEKPASLPVETPKSAPAQNVEKFTKQIEALEADKKSLEEKLAVFEGSDVAALHETIGQITELVQSATNMAKFKEEFAKVVGE